MTPDNRSVAVHPLADPLRAHALSLPEAWEDHPWGENVAKVGKKVFVFFGLADGEHPFGMTVKLPESYDAAMALPWARNPGYRMDRGHWVWLQPPDDAPFEMLSEWITESYRAVAPRALHERVDGPSATDQSASTQEG
jgi:predicted DNA-binding protein (MmcQ/YjbR family)